MDMLSRLFLLVTVITWSTLVDSKECGNNPMNPIQTVAQRTGKTVEHVLSVLRDIDGAAFETLSRRFRVYASCVGAADTAYFRRRRQHPPPTTTKTRTISDLTSAEEEMVEEDREGSQQWRRRRHWEEPIGDDEDDRVERMESWIVGPSNIDDQV